MKNIFRKFWNNKKVFYIIFVFKQKTFEILITYHLSEMESWQSGRLRRSWKPLDPNTVPGVRIPHSPLNHSQIKLTSIIPVRVRIFPHWKNGEMVHAKLWNSFNLTDFLFYRFLGLNAMIAQLVEYRPSKPRVAGSRPVHRSNKSSMMNWLTLGKTWRVLAFLDKYTDGLLC